jgi:C4-dicarboxylate-specific signal transduction histidine kinase
MLLERRRRIRAQHVLDESRAQVAHIARVATLGELAAAISHELSQPLTAIRASAEAAVLFLTRATPRVNDAREILRDIVKNGSRASEVLEHIRMLVRKETPASEPVDLNHVCSRVVQLLDHDAGRRELTLRLALDPGVELVTGDAVQLQQVVLNLALNAMDAVEASPPNGRVPEVVVGTSAGNESAEIFVRDTGPGLPPDLQLRIFEPFFSTKSHGLGMGLAIVRSIVERHHGRVRAENADAGGAVFRVQLPVARSESPAAALRLRPVIHHSSRESSTPA